QSLDRDYRRRVARLESRSWLSRRILEQLEKQFEANSDAIETERVREHPDLFGAGQFRRSRSPADNLELGQMEEGLTAFSLVTFFIWRPLWVVWAFLTRGGFSYRLAGLALVRGDGRPASRLQCAWRALLVWTPVTVLLVLSLWLESRYWSAWELGDP